MVIMRKIVLILLALMLLVVPFLANEDPWQIIEKEDFNTQIKLPYYLRKTDFVEYGNYFFATFTDENGANIAVHMRDDFNGRHMKKEQYDRRDMVLHPFRITNLKDYNVVQVSMGDKEWTTVSGKTTPVKVGGHEMFKCENIFSIKTPEGTKELPGVAYYVLVNGYNITFLAATDQPLEPYVEMLEDIIANSKFPKPVNKNFIYLTLLIPILATILIRFVLAKRPIAFPPALGASVCMLIVQYIVVEFTYIESNPYLLLGAFLAALLVMFWGYKKPPQYREDPRYSAYGIDRVDYDGKP